MHWLELAIPFLALAASLPCAALAFVYARSAQDPWRFRLLRFILASAGVSALMAVSIFLKRSELVTGTAPYFAVWSAVFLLLAAAGHEAIGVALRVVGSDWKRRLRAAYALGTAAAYALTLRYAVGGREDLFFPYIQGAFSATTIYLCAALGSAFLILLLRRGRLSARDRAAFGRFVAVFGPLGALLFLDELFRATRWLEVPRLPLVHLAALALYVFATAELYGRLRAAQGKRPERTDDAEVEREALAVEAACLGSPLTQRERDVLRELLRGSTNARIAADLDISANTVKNHVYSVYQKTGAGSRGELRAFALRDR